MMIGRMTITRPHRARHWWSGICFEWGDYGHKPPYRPNAHFVRIYIQ